MPETSLQELKPRVVHCKREPFDVYIGRPSKWGNPFEIGKDGTRAEVIAKYRVWLLSRYELREDARIELKGKTLGCWCSPKPCHGDVLLELANSTEFPCPLATLPSPGYAGSPADIPPELEEECPKNLFNL